MGKGKFISQIELSCEQTDINDRLRPYSFMGIAQEIAERDSERLGFGYFDLLPRHKTWVLAKMRIEFVEDALWKESLNAETWHRGLEGPCFIREARLTDKSGKVKVSAVSSWVILDTETRMMEKPSDAAQYITPEPVCDEKNGEAGGKIQFPKSAENAIHTSRIVSYSDIDHNGHTNNAVYIKWAMDCIPQDISLSWRCKELSINFNKETRPSQTVDLRMVQTGNSDLLNTYIVEGRSDGLIAFCAKMVFQRL